MKLYSIGQASEMIGVPVPAIRYYESVGLCTPSFTDTSTGYRYYSIDDIFKLDLIRSLGRQMGMPLKAIRSFIKETGDQEAILKYLSQQNDDIDKQIAALMERKVLITEKIKAIEHRKEITLMEPCMAHHSELCLSAENISADSLEDAILQARRVAAAFLNKGIRELFLIIADYRPPVSHFESTDLTVGLPLILPDFPVIRLPEGEYASISYPNSDESRGIAHEMLRNYIADNGYKTEGPMICSGSLIDTTSVSSKDYIIKTQIRIVENAQELQRPYVRFYKN